MVRLDNFKASASIDCLRDFDAKSFIKRADFDENHDKIEAVWYKLRNEREIENGLERKIGIKSIQISEGKLQLEVTGKLLKNRYAELINKDNIVYALESVNKSGLVDIDTSEFLDTAQIYKFDVTNNLPVTKHSDIYLRDISILGSKRKYQITPYKSGFVMTNKAKTVDERLIAYGKYEDLLKKDKWNKEILKYIDVNDYKNVFRIEGNYRTYDTMRKYFRLKKHNRDILLNKPKPVIQLSEILLYEGNPNINLFDNMISEKPDKTGALLSEMLDSDIALYKVEKQIGRAKIIEFCNYDMINVRRLLKSKLQAKNISRYLREYELLLKQLKTRELPDYSNINEVRELLKAS